MYAIVTVRSFVFKITGNVVDSFGPNLHSRCSSEPIWKWLHSE